MDWLAESCECIQGRLGEHGKVVLDGREARESTFCSESFEIENMASNCYCRSLLDLRVLARYDPKWDVGD